MSNAEKIESVLIIGLGNFGQFIASIIPKNQAIEIMGCDIKAVETDPAIKIIDLGRAAVADVIILAVPLSKYEAVLEPLAKLISRESLLVDVCSVKMKPERLIEEYLPNHPNLLLSHPLFGPRSVPDGLKGHKLAVTRTVGDKANQVLRHCSELGLEIEQVTAQEHDEAMKIHALTLFVAKALNNMGIQANLELPTPSSSMLVDLVEFSQTSSPDLIHTIQIGNPFAKAIRQKFMEQLQQIDEEWT